MEHRAKDALLTIADVTAQERGFLTRRERLLRWAECLEQDPSRRLRSLGEIEFVPAAERRDIRADESPLTVAFADPILRADGLASDRLGDAMDYFEISEWRAHRLLCSCMNGWHIQAGSFAKKLRRMSDPRADLRTGAVVAGAVGLPLLLMLLI
ncbi:hypothetical protein [Microvirga massiliensis]|uniref:hypothetical protein n=1 Tax=Microvirga massiliensis TaxID=1033741 RepID=UPI00065F8CFD|nr:hypothetical protein [Microvirga massiliensis]